MSSSKCFLIWSIVNLLFFFPTGIFAFIYSIKYCRQRVSNRQRVYEIGGVVSANHVQLDRLSEHAETANVIASVSAFIVWLPLVVLLTNGAFKFYLDKFLDK